MPKLPALRMLALAAGAALLAAGAAVTSQNTVSAAPGSPTDGWRQEAFDHHMQKPWNLDLDERYRFDQASGTHRMWVYSTDEPHSRDSATDPRTEMRWHQEYSSGRHMWDADVYIPSGSNGASFMQILRIERPSGTPATDIMLRISDANGGTVERYNSEVVKTGVYDTWWNLKVAHDADSGEIRVWADDEPVLTAQDRGPATRHFKNGVYHHGDGRAEARFRDIRYWVR